MIATSMALLSTGADLDKETQIHRGLFEAALSAGEREAPTVHSADVQVLDSDLLLNSTGLLLDHQSTSSNPIGNFSPVYSPLSTTSADSGVGGSGGLTTPENDTFLAELFGSNFPLLSQASTSAYTPNGSLVSAANANAPLASSAYSRPMLAQNELRISSLDGRVSFDEQPVEKNRKNAEAARQNRLKKKKYVEELEKEHSETKCENVILKTKCHEYQSRCQRLQAEVEYLKNVIANESTLSSLIQNIPNVPNVKLSSSFSSRKRPHTASSKDSAPTSKRSKSSSKETTSGGVCLHVAKDLVSIEFCQHCSKQAKQS